MLNLLPPSPVVFALRAYQIDAHAATREAYARGVCGAMLVMATGTGKTATALSLVIQDYLSKGLRVVWLAHREELLTQPKATVAKFWPTYAHRVGIVQAATDHPEADLVCASVATLACSPHRVDAILSHGPIALVVVDEAHHSTSPTQQAAIQALGAPRRLGLTATPTREDGADLSEDWEIVFSYGIMDAIQDGALLPPFSYFERLPDLDLSKISGRRDYDDAELGAELLRAGVVDHTVQAMSKAVEATRLPDRDLVASMSAKGRACLVFTATVDQAERTAAALREAGWNARHISGTTPKSERRRLLRAFSSGAIDVLCNAAVLTEGTDLPRASVVVLARPTRSWSLFVQMVGRGLRLYDGQSKALIIDLAGATEEHSLIAAPVLIGGSRCPKSPNGVHDFVAGDNPQEGAKCEHCPKKVSCGITLSAHTWNEEHHCEACGRAQCPDSEDSAHHWVPQADHKRKCLDCGMEIPDPLAGMLRERRANPVEADWVRVRGVAPETYVVDIGDHGLLYVQRQRPGWMPIWLVKGGRRPRPLASKPLRTEWVRAYADDLVRRAEKVAAVDAAWKQRAPDRKQRTQANFAGVEIGPSATAGDVARSMLRIRSRDRAIKTGIAKPC